MLTSIWALAAKDLRMYFRDSMGLVTSLLVPIALVTVFGWLMAYAFGGSGGMPKVKLWVVDLDNSARSQQFVQSLRESSMLDCLPRPDDRPIDRERLQQMVADGDAHHGLVIPAGFGASTSGSLPPDMEMIRDPGRQMEDRILQFALLQSFIGSGDNALWKGALTRWIKSEGASESELKRFDEIFDTVEKTIQSGIDDMAVDGWGNQAGAAPQPAPTSSDPLTNNQLNMDDMLSMLDNAMPVTHVDITPPERPKRITFQQAQSISGVSVMMMMFSLTGAGALLLAERERGTLRRLIALPMPREHILLGKFLYVVIVGLIQMAVLMAYGELMFKVGLFRDPLTLAILILSWVVTAGSFGMAIATLSTSTKQGDGIATIIILVMAALGGCWFPVQMMSLPLPLEIASKSTLTYWAMEGFQGMLWNGLAWSDSKMIKAIGIQWLWAACLSTVSIYAFRRNYLQ